MQDGWWGKNMLSGVVFITGGCVLVLEVTATRLLSPYYGTTIFTVSSVIGVVLAALSAGYYLGGRMADKYTREDYLFNIILLSGLSVLGLQLLVTFVLPLSAYALTMISGPPLFSVLLFFGPALLLGMVSPYVVAIQHKRWPERGAGSTAGGVFFWGTAGSIIGTFLTGFYLIPSFGLKTIVTGVALTLLGIGLLGRSKPLAGRRGWISLGGVMLAVGLSLWLIRQVKLSDQVVFLKDGIYDRVAVTNINYQGRAARVLWQDATAESAIYLSDGETAFAFNKYFELYKLARPNLSRALVIGGGAMIVPKMLLETDPEVIVEVAEIEPLLFDLAERYFGVPKSNRLRPAVEDGRRYLHNSAGEYDLIYLDAYRGWHVPPHLVTEEFLRLVREKLSVNGVVVANLIGKIDADEVTYANGLIETWRRVWPNSYFFAADDPASRKMQNLAAVGFVTGERVNLAPVAPLMPGSLLRTLPEQMIDEQRLVVKDAPVYTDDYAPVEWLLARDLQRFGSQE